MANSNNIFINKNVKKNNFFAKLKGFITPLIKQTIYYDNELYNILLTEEEYNNQTKIELKYRALWLRWSGNKKIQVVNLNRYKNLFELLFFNKLSKTEIIKLLKTIGNRFSSDLTTFQWYIENLPYPHHIKTALLSSNSLYQTLKKYEFKGKKELITKLESLETRETKERWKEYLEIARELELEDEMGKKIKNSLIEPWLYILIMIWIVIFFNEKFFPVLLELWKANPKIVWQITTNPLYVFYHWILENWIMITLIWIASIILFFVLKSISLIKKHFQRFILSMPFLWIILKYKELSRIISVFITYYKYKITQATFYTYISAGMVYYKERFYTMQKTVIPKNVVKEMLETGFIPAEEWANLLSILSTDPYWHIDKMLFLKEEILKRYDEAVQKLIKTVKMVVMIAIFIIVWIVINASYWTIYSIVTNFM